MGLNSDGARIDAIVGASTVMPSSVVIATGSGFEYFEANILALIRRRSIGAPLLQIANLWMQYAHFE